MRQTFPTARAQIADVQRLPPKGRDATHAYIRLSSIHDPSILVYLPPKEKATGAAVVIGPGGGHQFLAMDVEGYEIVDWLNSHGIAGFILKYRLARDLTTAYLSSCGKCHTDTLRGRNGDAGELPPLSSLSAGMLEVVQGYGGKVPPLAGANPAFPPFLTAWGTKTTKDLSRRVREAVGGFPPQGCDDETYLNLTAYFLQANGARPGTQPLNAATAVEIRLITRTSPRQCRDCGKKCYCGAGSQPAEGCQPARAGRQPPSRMPSCPSASPGLCLSARRRSDISPKDPLDCWKSIPDEPPVTVTRLHVTT